MGSTKKLVSFITSAQHEETRAIYKNVKERRKGACKIN